MCRSAKPRPRTGRTSSPMAADWTSTSPPPAASYGVSPKRTSARPSSAGILAYRRVRHGLEVLLVHPGGPYWRNKDDGAWSIPKGEIGTSEDPEQTARREFTEEHGPAASIGHLQALGEIRQRGGKRVIAFCGETDFDTSSLSSNTFEIEWPPKSGRLQPFPEVDRAEWFDLEAARSKILSGQIELIDRLEKDVTRREYIGSANLGCAPLTCRTAET